MGTVVAMDATARFSEVVRSPAGELRLDTAAMLIAAHASPDLDVDAELRRLDDLAAGCGEPTLDALRRHLFVELGFSGNAVEYYDPRNSFLNEVLDRRTGIPISLAVVTMEVARRLGLPLVGVGMPGHFLLRDRLDPDLFLDPFARGALLDRSAAEVRFHQVHGGGALFDPAFLEPVGGHDILARMLANLRTIYHQAGDPASLEWVLRLRLELREVPREERRALASVLASLGRVQEAAAELDRLATEVGDDAAETAAAAAQRLRASLN